MAVDGYGALARFPREIRDQIYEDLLTVTDVGPIAKLARSPRVVLSVYVAQPNTNILRVSRALYHEILPVCVSSKHYSSALTFEDLEEEIPSSQTDAYHSRYWH